jgi:hypothetical protein
MSARPAPAVPVGPLRFTVRARSSRPDVRRQERTAHPATAPIRVLEPLGWRCVGSVGRLRGRPEVDGRHRDRA